MKKFLLFLLLILLIVPILTTAQGLVPCGQEGKPRCELNDIFELVLRVFKFLVYDISTVLAGLGIVIGGILILISGGPGGANPITGIASPNMYSTGKRIITGAIFGWFLIWGAWLIIHTVCLAIGPSLLSC